MPWFEMVEIFINISHLSSSHCRLHLSRLLAEAVVSHEAVTVRVKYCNEMVIIFFTRSPRAIGRRAPTKDIVSFVITWQFSSSQREQESV